MKQKYEYQERILRECKDRVLNLNLYKTNAITAYQLAVRIYLHLSDLLPDASSNCDIKYVYKALYKHIPYCQALITLDRVYNCNSWEITKEMRWRAVYDLIRPRLILLYDKWQEKPVTQLELSLF